MCPAPLPPCRICRLGALCPSGVSAKWAFDNRQEDLSVARHKQVSCRERDTEGNWIEYESAVNSSFQPVPEGNVYAELQADYEKMLADRMLLDDEAGFGDLMRRFAELENETKSLQHQA